MNIPTSLPQPVSFRPPSHGLAAVGIPSAPVDTYGPARPESLEGLYRRPVFAQGHQEAVGIAGLGVMRTGLMAGAALGGCFGPVVRMGSMFAGLALMAAAR